MLRTLKLIALCCVLSLSVSSVRSIFADTSSISVTVIIPECNDGIDNDSDLIIDYPNDPGCVSLTDNDETDPVTPACSDALDNDSDSKVDYPNDLGCDSASDNNESGEIVVVPGVGGGGPPGSVNPLPTGTQVIFQGTAFPSATVTVLTNGSQGASTKADKDGDFSLTITEISPGLYLFSLYSSDAMGHISKPVTYTLRLARGSVTELKGILLPLPEELDSPIAGCVEMGDMNDDCRVDLVDFSILAYWWQRPLEDEMLEIEVRELNGDGVAELEDFSILAYHWTG